MFSLTDKNSFNSIRDWIKKIKEDANERILIILVGNKNDLRLERQVNKEEAEKLAKECNTKYISNPCCDFNLENNYRKNNNIRIIDASINLPNSNNMNSYFESKLNQNDEEGFNISLSPITKTKKNTVAVKPMNLH